MRTEVVVGLDVGGTAIKGGLLDRSGHILHQQRWVTPVAAGPEAVVTTILAAAAELIDESPAGTDVVAIGLGVPGMVDSRAGIARYAANLGWSEVPLVRLLMDRSAVPVGLGHDVQNAGLAEGRMGAGATDTSSMFFVSLGTGIAGALVESGAVREGALGQAGEVGHLVVRPGGPLCGCGNRGCLETLASASRIAQRYTALTGDVRTAEHVAGLVGTGEPAARQIWAEAVDALADALAAVTVLLDPGRLVLGGGLSLAGATLTDPLAPALGARLTFRTPPPISLATLGDRAGLLGAALRGWDAVDRP